MVYNGPVIVFFHCVNDGEMEVLCLLLFEVKDKEGGKARMECIFAGIKYAIHIEWSYR